MKLEVGKFYRSREGKKVGPMQDDWHLEKTPWHAPADPERSGDLWDEGGRSYNSIQDAGNPKKWDLVAEWVDAVAVPKHYEFWMVYGLGQRAPTHEHLTYEQAANEAQRLARECPGIRFFVLEAKRGFVLAQTPVIEIELDPNEVPF